MQSILPDPLAIPACLGVGRASFSQIAAVFMVETPRSPKLVMQNTKTVNLRHMPFVQLCVFLMILCVLSAHSLSTAASSTHCCGQRHQIRGSYRQHWVQWPPQTCRNINRAALEQLFLIVREEAIRAKERGLEPLSERQQARSETYTKKAPMSRNGQSGVNTSNSAWTQANSEFSKALRYKWRPATSVVSGWQLGRCLAFRQSTRE